MARMKAVLFSLCLTVLALTAGARDYKLYAILLEETPVELVDGGKWVMDKGDVFPVLMFKEMQTKLVLQLAGTSFWVDAKRTRILKNDEIAAGLANYRKTVQAYLDSKSKQLKSELKPATAEEAKTP